MQSPWACWSREMGSAEPFGVAVLPEPALSAVEGVARNDNLGRFC